jgi:UDP-2-acetamido-3-amino-2,3-dideoxy-glucuronate N-acetyltransferase
MVFTNVTNPRSFINRKNEYKRTLVRRGASLGANSTIVCGVTIGEYAFVGAGAVVTRDVAPFSLVVGSPAKQIGWVCRCGVRLQISGETTHCDSCGQSYAVQSNKLTPTQSTFVMDLPEQKTPANSSDNSVSSASAGH